MEGSPYSSCFSRNGCGDWNVWYGWNSRAPTQRGDRPTGFTVRLSQRVQRAYCESRGSKSNFASYRLHQDRRRQTRLLQEARVKQRLGGGGIEAPNEKKCLSEGEEEQVEGRELRRKGRKVMEGEKLKQREGIYRWWLMGNGFAGQGRKSDASPERGSRFPVAISPGML